MRRRVVDVHRVVREEPEAALPTKRRHIPHTPVAVDLRLNLDVIGRGFNWLPLMYRVRVAHCLGSGKGVIEALIIAIVSKSVRRVGVVRNTRQPKSAAELYLLMSFTKP